MSIHITDNRQRPIIYTAKQFAGGEWHIQLLPVTADDVTQTSELIIRANLVSADSIMKLLLVVNALRARYGAQLLLRVELPYLPYARQDRVCAEGQAFSLSVFSALLQTMAIDQLVTWDCHSEVGIALTGAINISPATIIQSSPELMALIQHENSVLVCPDNGAISRCQEIATALDKDTIVFAEKTRDPLTGKIVGTEVLTDNLSGKCAVITDDICDGGYTFIKLAEQLKQKQVARIVLFVTHGIFSKGVEVFDGLIDDIITTNSFKQNINKSLKVIDFKYEFNMKKGVES